MKKLLMTLAALPVATMAIEASAQTYGQPYGQAYGQTNVDARLATRIQNLEMRYQAALNARVLTDNERVVIGRQLANLRALQQRVSYDGRLTNAERRQLQQQIRTTRDQLRTAGGNGWANRYGWTDRDLDAYGNAYGSTYGNAYGNNAYGSGRVTYDQYGRPIPSMTYDQYGRPITNNGYYGQGGPYVPAPSSNGGIGGVLGNVLGGGSGVGGILGSILGNGGLSVGSVISGAIGSALGGGSNYGYRDRNDVYFRSDGQRVYEIDARTNTVIRVHPLR